jgi:succinyl-CoA synthetase beta subunit
VERWTDRLRDSDPWTELEALRLLSDYGIPTIPTVGASDLDGAVRAARELGWPVALKSAAGAGHKTEAGGITLGIGAEDDLAAAYRDMAARLGPEVVVQAMAPAGVEVAFGMVRDEQFGPIVLVAAGGVLVEVLNDRRTGLPPFGEHRARRMIDGLALRPLLDGVRGRPPSDVDALAAALARLSVLASDLGAHLDALDVNPLIVHPKGCVAVDALVVPRR